MDDGLAREMKSELTAIANIVAEDARARVPDGSGRARASIKAGSQVKGAYVQGGKQAVPYYGWLDFGTRNPQHGQPRTAGPWKRSGKGPAKGRFIYPALEGNERNIEKRTLRAVKVARKKAGL